jgi:hypothetical protein
MDNSNKFCVVCGRKIPELSLRKKVCSDFCRRRKKNGYAPYINCVAPPFEELTELQKKASAEGMSYGQYMAMKYEKEKRGGAEE